MTRETKIGLLVGLAFIIVIGILLSDHLTSTNEPQQAQLAKAGDSVRSGVTTPGSAAATAANPPIVNTAQQQAVAPQQTVPTKEELTPKQPAVEIVQIGGATPPTKPAQAQDQAVAQGGTTTEQPQQLSAQQGVTNGTPVARTSDANVPGSLANVAKTMGEEVVPVGQATQVAPKPPAGSATPVAGKQYKAEAGDSVSKMATKFFGANTKANRDAIVAANPSLQQNANMVVVGRTYVIPVAGGSATPQAAAPAPAPAPVAEKPASAPEYFYTVKPNDSLSKIAIEQMGSASALAAIRDLNKDLLKGGDLIHPNMKLRLPSKPIASAQ